MSLAFIISLLVMGVLLLLIEIFIVPGIGISGILGVAALCTGCWMSFDYGLMPGLFTSGFVLLTIIVLIIIALREKTWSRLTLNAKVDSAAGQNASVVSPGDCGVTSTRLAPMGTARISDKSVEVKSLEGFIDPGIRITVVMIEDNIIYVKPFENTF